MRRRPSHNSKSTPVEMTGHRWTSYHWISCPWINCLWTIRMMNFHRVRTNSHWKRCIKRMTPRPRAFICKEPVSRNPIHKMRHLSECRQSRNCPLATGNRRPAISDRAATTRDKRLAGTYIDLMPAGKAAILDEKTFTSAVLPKITDMANNTSEAHPRHSRHNRTSTNEVTRHKDTNNTMLVTARYHHHAMAAPAAAGLAGAAALHWASVCQHLNPSTSRQNEYRIAQVA